MCPFSGPSVIPPTPAAKPVTGWQKRHSTGHSGALLFAVFGTFEKTRFRPV